MASSFQLEIVTPGRNFFTGQVETVILKTPEGEIGILQGHIPMVAAVAEGPVRILQNGEWLDAALTRGFMEVKQDRTVILTDTAEWPDEIDANRAKAAKERAEERLHHKLSQLEYMQSQAALARALTRLKVTKRFK